jgi:SAM-dependent methyltransferase
LRHHESLSNYSQIEACESFYILQNLVNLHCFGHLCDDRALPHENTPAIDFFAAEGPVSEFSTKIRVDGVSPRSTHYPWWRIGELISRARQFDIITSNANLLEFNRTALDDYLSLISRVLAPEGALLVQCTGYPAQGNDESLLNTMHDKGFAPLLFVQPNKSAKSPTTNGSSLKQAVDQGTLPQVTFNVTNALFVRRGHPLFSRYYDKKNFHLHFIAPEPIVMRTYFDRPAGRTYYTPQHFTEEIERSIAQ